jgi:hypothetical protein
MAQVIIRNLDPETVRRLKARAKRSGRSLEAELRTIVAEAVSHDRSEFIAWLDEHVMPARPGFDAVEAIHEGRDERMRRVLGESADRH